MQRILRSRWLFLIALVILAACGGGPATPEPAKIRFGDTICAECGMIISQPKYASSFAYAESEGRFKSLAFDDIGDMLMFASEHPTWTIRRRYVHDYASAEWLPAETARFVRSPEIRSPMGHGLAAFADRAQAEELARSTHGQVVSFDALADQHGGPTPGSN